MTALRVLHVDDEPDIREVVEMSLGLDPDIVMRSCPSGEAALAVAEDWLHERPDDDAPEGRNVWAMICDIEALRNSAS